MGRIIDSKEMFDNYQEIIEQEYFVDKSNLINKFNKLIRNTGSKYVCITKPRRFGKTLIAAMLITYYSKSIDSKIIFDKLKVSKGISSNKDENKVEIDQYNEFQKKYHTLYFDFSLGVNSHKTLKGYLKSINKKLKKDIKELYPNSNVLKEYDREIFNNLQEIYMTTNEKFIIIIDEWDYIISNNLFSPDDQRKYIGFLNDLLKNRGYVAFTYMTGILPIAKQLSQSTINCFTEYSVLNDKDYYQYFGFTEQEVKVLCRINNAKYNNNKNKSLEYIDIDNNKNKSLEYKDIEDWYNGYKSYNGKKIFNSWSVYHALQNNRIENYWTKTGRFNEVVDSIDFKIHGVKNDIFDLIKGNNISIKLEKYGAEDLLKDKETNDSQKKTKKDKNKNNINKKKQLYSKMVTFGFLTYYDGKISIPNKELKEEFIKVLEKKKNLNYLYDLINNSNKMLELTIKKDVKGMCKMLEYRHMKTIKPNDKMDHGNLKHVIDYAYFNAKDYYDIKEEESSGKGSLDYIFYPKIENEEKKPVIIIELKTNGSAENAINQIHEKKYWFKIEEKELKENILLVGISLAKNKKEYTCKIEEYANVSELKSAENEMERENKTKKRKRESSSNYESGNVYQGTRSRTKKKSKK